MLDRSTGGSYERDESGGERMRADGKLSELIKIAFNWTANSRFKWTMTVQSIQLGVSSNFLYLKQLWDSSIETKIVGQECKHMYNFSNKLQLSSIHLINEFWKLIISFVSDHFLGCHSSHLCSTHRKHHSDDDRRTITPCGCIWLEYHIGFHLILVSYIEYAHKGQLFAIINLT